MKCSPGEKALTTTQREHRFHQADQLTTIQVITDNKTQLDNKGLKAQRWIGIRKGISRVRPIRREIFRIRRRYRVRIGEEENEMMTKIENFAIFTVKNKEINYNFK